MGFTETEIDGVIQKERQQFKKKKIRRKSGNDCLLCSPDVRLCAGLPVQRAAVHRSWAAPPLAAQM